MSLWTKIYGTAESYWQIGLNGPKLKNNSGVVEITSGGTGIVTFALRCNGGQTADLQQWLDSSGNELSCVTPVGWFNISGAAAPFPTSPLFISITGGNSYLQTNIQNKSAGISASSDMVATADTGTDSTNYIDVGINSSTYADPLYSGQGPLDSYVIAYGGNLGFGTATASKTVKFFSGGTLTSNLRLTVSDTAFTFNSVGLVTPIYVSFTEYAINGGVAVTSNFAPNFTTNGQKQVVLLGASVSITSLTFPGAGNYILRIVQDNSGNRVLTWPAAVQAPGGKAAGLVLSTAGNSVDIVAIYYDGSTARAVISKGFAP
jgi:hypothetical protein